jgi:hypothetical protein
MMERRSFLKLLGFVSGGALLSVPAVAEVERLVLSPALGATSLMPHADFSFLVSGVDIGPWINDIVMPRVDYEHIEVTSFDDEERRFIPSLRRMSELDLVFKDLPQNRFEHLSALLNKLDTVDYKLVHHLSGWRWSGRAYIKSLLYSTDQQVSCTFQPTGPAELMTI